MPKKRGNGQFLGLRWELGKKDGVMFLRGVVDTPMINLSYLELWRIDLPKLNSSILTETVTIPVGKVNEFYFYMHYPIKAWLFLKKLSLN